MKKHVIDPNKLAETFGIPWTHSVEKDCETGKITKVYKNSYNFLLNEEGREESMRLYFNKFSNNVTLSIETKNGYGSTIYFSNITKVVYIPQYHAIQLESHTPTHYSVLEISWRGQFDLTINGEEETYPKTVWAKRDDY